MDLEEDAAADGAGEEDLRYAAEEEEYDLFGPEAELDDKFAGLTLHGEEEEDLDFSKEVDELISDVRWLALFRVHTTRPFSHAALLK